MFSKITSRISATAVTGLFVLTIGLGVLSGGGHAHAAPIDTSGNPYDAATCTFEGKDYSEGSRVKMADGNVYKCSTFGTWILAIVAPPTGNKFDKIQTAGVLQRAP